MKYLLALVLIVASCSVADAGIFSSRSRSVVVQRNVVQRQRVVQQNIVVPHHQQFFVAPQQFFVAPQRQQFFVAPQRHFVAPAPLIFIR